MKKAYQFVGARMGLGALRLFQRRGFILNKGDQGLKIDGFTFAPLLNGELASFDLKARHAGRHDRHQSVGFVKLVGIAMESCLTPAIFKICYQGN